MSEIEHLRAEVERLKHERGLLAEAIVKIDVVRPAASSADDKAGE